MCICIYPSLITTLLNRNAQLGQDTCTSSAGDMHPLLHVLAAGNPNTAQHAAGIRTCALEVAFASGDHDEPVPPQDDIVWRCCVLVASVEQGLAMGEERGVDCQDL